MKEIKKAQMGIIAVLAAMLVSMIERLPVTRRLSSGIMTLTLAGIVLLVAVGGASAATQITSCQVIDASTGDGSGVYELAHDIHNTAGVGVCIDIQVDDVILDGKGYCIDGDTIVAYRCGVGASRYNAGGDNVTIKNVEITNFGTGIDISTGWASGQPPQKFTNVLIKNCSVHDNGATGSTFGTAYGVHCVHVCDSTITRNDIYNQLGYGTGCGAGGDGIYMVGNSAVPGMGRNNTITCNHVHENIKGGIYLKCAADYNNISSNYCWGNGAVSGHGITGGIVVRCKASNWNTITYNNISDNIGQGIWCRGDNNSIKFNTVIANGVADIEIIGAGTGGDDNEISYNFAPVITTCGGSATPPDQNDCTGNFGVNNSCNTCTNCDGDNSISCPFTCDGQTSVYFDFDEDGHCSKDFADCACPCGSKCACCNPGVFNASGYTDAYSAACPLKTQSTPGSDPDDCLAYTVTGDLFECDGTTPVMGATVTMKNMKPGGDEWNAAVVGNTYTVKVDPVLDISAGNILRITAKNVSDAEGWTDHKVHTCDIALEGFTADVIIDNYILNYYPCYPYYIQEEDNWSGPAVMKACIAHYIDPPSQETLNETGIGNNHPDHPDLLYVDPLGMEATMDSYLHPTGHNYGVFPIATAEDALYRICYWQNRGPGAVPAYGDYSNWMAIRGIRTNKTPTDYAAPYDYDVHGFWVNNPNDLGDIGENTYKTAADFTNTYYVPTVDNEVPAWDNKYMSVLEPPEQDAEVRIVPVRTRFASPVELEMAEVTLEVDDTKRPVLEMAIKDDGLLKIVKAAIDGVNEELVPYDAEFASVFAKTVAGKPMFVTGDNDYCIVPFNLPAKEKIEKFDVEDALVVVLVDAEDGSFKEASWVADPVEYLPVSDREALKLIFNEQASISKTRPMIKLVYRDASPYHPDWRITIGNDVYFVGQDGTVS